MAETLKNETENDKNIIDKSEENKEKANVSFESLLINQNLCSFLLDV